jgi:hypothetical protein
MPNGQAYLELEIDLVDSLLSHAGLTGHGLDEAPATASRHYFPGAGAGFLDDGEPSEFQVSRT